MKKENRYIFITALALFSLFFGAGNLILPPFLGLKGQGDWPLLALGFAISAVLIPIFGILAHARLQGSMLDFARPVSKLFALIYCFTVYGISVSLPSPRTASVTHEMAIAPFFNLSPWVTSSLYFTLVFVFVLNRGSLLGRLGKWLTPALLILLFFIMLAPFFMQPPPAGTLNNAAAFSFGLTEGYQTFDAIGAVVVGGVIIISLKMGSRYNYHQKKNIIAKAGLLAGAGLLTVYAGLIHAGAVFSGIFTEEITRTALLLGMGNEVLGYWGRVLLSLIVGLACFTTAIGIITGTADFVKQIFNENPKAYVFTAFGGCLLGVLMGGFDVHTIIAIALPALMFIYPLTIVLILLHNLPQQWRPRKIFIAVVAVTLLFSIPDFLASLGFNELKQDLFGLLSGARWGLTWFLPASMTLVGLNAVRYFRKDLQA